MTRKWIVGTYLLCFKWHMSVPPQWVLKTSLSLLCHNSTGSCSADVACVPIGLDRRPAIFLVHKYWQGRVRTRTVDCQLCCSAMCRTSGACSRMRSGMLTP
jgi:hypothetical protein